jgi:hypothetical protein
MKLNQSQIARFDYTSERINMDYEGALRCLPSIVHPCNAQLSGKKRKPSFSLYSEEEEEDAVEEEGEEEGEGGSRSVYDYTEEEEYKEDIPYMTPRKNPVRETRNEKGHQLPSELSTFEIPSPCPLLRSDSKIMFGKYFYSILFYSILFYSILFYSILFYAGGEILPTLNSPGFHLSPQKLDFQLSP